MKLTAHPYNQYLPVYNFFFHPLHFHKKEMKILAVITNICVSLLTGGLFQIPFWIINRLDDRKLEVWKRKNTPRVHAAVDPIFNPPPSAKSAKLPPTKTSPSNPGATLSDHFDLKQAWTFFSEYKCPIGGVKPSEQPAFTQALEYQSFLETYINRTFKEKLLAQGNAWNDLQVISQFNLHSKNWNIALIGDSEAKLKSNYTFHKAGSHLIRSTDRKHDFLEIKLSSLESNDCFKRFSQALDFGHQCKTQLEAALFNEKGDCRILPSNELFLYMPSIEMLTEKPEAHFHLVMDDEKEGRNHGIYIELKNVDFDLTTDELTATIQSRFREGLSDRKEQRDSYGHYNFFKKPEEQLEPLQASDIDRLDELLELEGSLKAAYQSGDKQKGLELVADGKMRRAALKFHPDKVENKEEGERLFKEFRELAYKVKNHFSNL